MRSAVTISLPEELRGELDRLAADRASTRSQIVREALDEYLYLRRFRQVRRDLLTEAAKLGIHTDEDVFERIS